MVVTLKELVNYALSLNPNNQSWLCTQADIYFGKLKLCMNETLIQQRSNSEGFFFKSHDLCNTLHNTLFHSSFTEFCDVNDKLFILISF